MPEGHEAKTVPFLLLTVACMGACVRFPAVGQVITGRGNAVEACCECECSRVVEHGDVDDPLNHTCFFCSCDSIGLISSSKRGASGCACVQIDVRVQRVCIV